MQENAERLDSNQSSQYDVISWRYQQSYPTHLSTQKEACKRI